MGLEMVVIVGIGCALEEAVHWDAPHIRDWGALSVELGRMNPRGRCAPAESGGNDLRQH